MRPATSPSRRVSPSGDELGAERVVPLPLLTDRSVHGIGGKERLATLVKSENAGFRRHRLRSFHIHAALRSMQLSIAASSRTTKCGST
jgi:hypothetical protein